MLGTAITAEFPAPTPDIPILKEAKAESAKLK
jgi:hypothetical protein